MQFPSPLTPARLIRRYKRFLFDAKLESGEFITGSCPNTGSMRGPTTPGSLIWAETHDNPNRKYRHSLELVEAEGTLVGINTGRPNRLANRAVARSTRSRTRGVLMCGCASDHTMGIVPPSMT